MIFKSSFSSSSSDKLISLPLKNKTKQLLILQQPKTKQKNEEKNDETKLKCNAHNPPRNSCQMGLDITEINFLYPPSSAIYLSG